MNRYVVFASPAVLLAAYIAWPAIATAGEASVVKAKATSSGNGYYFTVTVAHADTGWDHFANKFEILSPGGKVLGTRVLHHPHVDEQPFTCGSTVISHPCRHYQRPSSAPGTMSTRQAPKPLPSSCRKDRNTRLIWKKRPPPLRKRPLNLT